MCFFRYRTTTPVLLCGLHASGMQVGMICIRCSLRSEPYCPRRPRALGGEEGTVEFISEACLVDN